MRKREGESERETEVMMMRSKRIQGCQASGLAIPERALIVNLLPK